MVELLFRGSCLSRNPGLVNAASRKCNHCDYFPAYTLELSGLATQRSKKILPFFQRRSICQGHAQPWSWQFPKEFAALGEVKPKGKIMDLLLHHLLKLEAYYGLDWRTYNPRSAQLLNLHLSWSLDFSFKKAQGDFYLFPCFDYLVHSTVNALSNQQTSWKVWDISFPSSNNDFLPWEKISALHNCLFHR